ncbi:Lsr2 dimerization domain-containing protein [Frigoribacterium faeni]|uniref:Lsr2 dimerization domain-containing protein n=1 Tax=Frigoribacterium faeni TaxID=145483 RepID=A0A7W3JH07_9MICO|nr:histone-like nucleoid-structuring protein Lsr2 [Frigoribacterium faeni]MBA8812648.1 hypothetical protein [Frigoribacterium faeni]GEK82339.1 hypothetical protein FFA01_06480 [Frigoribacterium faeni]
MSQRTITQLIDDLDGSVIPGGMGRTVLFELDATTYELDLTDAHLDDLRAVLAPYVRAGRRTSKSLATKQRKKRAA